MRPQPDPNQIGGIFALVLAGALLASLAFLVYVLIMVLIGGKP
jgi:hypothetical protein